MPETLETFFYLWRATHNETYRDWAWQVGGMGRRARQHAGGGGQRHTLHQPQAEKKGPPLLTAPAADLPVI